MGQNMKSVHFGLGSVQEVDTITVTWPSGIVQVLKDVSADQRIVVAEPSS